MAKNYRPGGVGMINAELGTYLVHAYFDDNQVELVRSNVIGWQIGQERKLTPLVIDPDAAADELWFVVHPDNRVECSDGRCWADLDCWIAEERRRRRDALAKKQEKRAAPAEAKADEKPPVEVEVELEAEAKAEQRAQSKVEERPAPQAQTQAQTHAPMQKTAQAPARPAPRLPAAAPPLGAQQRARPAH